MKAYYHGNRVLAILRYEGVGDCREVVILYANSKNRLQQAWVSTRSIFIAPGRSTEPGNFG